jgi:hypothetical protein
MFEKEALVNIIQRFGCFETETVLLKLYLPSFTNKLDDRVPAAFEKKN